MQPTIRADRGWLHLEARYNYEALDTGSAWIGYNFSVGEKLNLEFTPMLGAVFGKTTGVAPGYEFTLSWRKLQLYSEGEYVFDTGDSAASFFYKWSELTLAPVDWFRFGLVVQRTKVYKTRFRRAARSSHPLHLQERGFGRLRVQSGRGQTDIRFGDEREFLIPRRWFRAP